jgi:hypothetical protein
MALTLTPQVKVVSTAVFAVIVMVTVTVPVKIVAADAS